jgi:hypothetical protein
MQWSAFLFRIGKILVLNFYPETVFRNWGSSQLPSYGGAVILKQASAASFNILYNSPFTVIAPFPATWPTEHMDEACCQIIQ